MNFVSEKRIKPLGKITLNFLSPGLKERPIRKVKKLKSGKIEIKRISMRKERFLSPAVRAKLLAIKKKVVSQAVSVHFSLLK